MDKAKKTRTALRATFTRTFSQLNHLLEQKNINTDELKTRFAIFKDKTCELQEMDQCILQLMQDSEEASEEDMIKEIESADEYCLKYERIKLSITNIVKPSTQRGQQHINESLYFSDKRCICKIRGSSYLK